MLTPLQILIVEDNPADAALYRRELRKAGFALKGPCVDNEEAFRQALRPSLDLILSDYELPQFSGLIALELRNQSGFEVPFILVSGTIGEDTAVEAMKGGAADYLLKDRLGRLGEAVKSALAQGRLRRERRRMHEALEANEALFRQVAERIQDVFWTTSPDSQQLLYVSPAYASVWGRSLTSLHAHPPQWSDAILDEDRPAVMAGLQALAAGCPYEREFRIRLPDGCIRWILDRRFAVHNSSGQVTILVGVARDITDRKRETEALAESERRLRDMLANLNLIAVMLDGTGRVTFCNDYLLQLTGWSREEIIGTDWFIRFVPNDWPKVRKDFDENIESGDIPSHYESPIKTRAGERRDIVWTTTALRDGAGSTVGLASLGADVTVRKAAEEQIREQLQELLRWQDVILNREERIGALKAEINVLRSRLGLPSEYQEAALS